MVIGTPCSLIRIRPIFSRLQLICDAPGTAGWPPIMSRKGAACSFGHVAE
jgi:hypothetical protein